VKWGCGCCGQRGGGTRGLSTEAAFVPCSSSSTPLFVPRLSPGSAQARWTTSPGIHSFFHKLWVKPPSSPLHLGVVSSVRRRHDPLCGRAGLDLSRSADSPPPPPPPTPRLPDSPDSPTRRLPARWTAGSPGSPGSADSLDCRLAPRTRRTGSIRLADSPLAGLPAHPAHPAHPAPPTRWTAGSLRGLAGLDQSDTPTPRLRRLPGLDLPCRRLVWSVSSPGLRCRSRRRDR
jgi:hypothetical protein